MSSQTAFSYERQVVYGAEEKVEIKSMASETGDHSRSHRRGRGRLHRLMNRIDRLTDDMAEQVKGFRGRRKQLTGSVEDLFGRYRSGEVENAPKDKLGREALQTVQSAFVEKIQTVTESASFNLSYAA